MDFVSLTRLTRFLKDLLRNTCFCFRFCCNLLMYQEEFLYNFQVVYFNISAHHLHSEAHLISLGHRSLFRGYFPVENYVKLTFPLVIESR